MFSPLPTPLNLPLLEEEVLRFWRRERIFDKACARREGGPKFVVYEKPPSTSGVPGAHHLLALACRDAILRYKSMKGYQILRRAGWNTHGIPVEVEVEKRLGIHSKGQIEAHGVGRFNHLCRKTAFNYIQDWERLTERFGYWADLEQAYVTFTNEYIESLWWMLKGLWEKRLLYQSEKVVPYCSRCATPLSDQEALQDLREADDPSILLRLPLVDEPGTSLLVWTSAPWMLPGNAAVAVHPEAEYMRVERQLEEGGTEHLILAAAQMEAVFPGEQLHVVEKFKGRRLRGRRYRPLFTFLLPEKPAYFVILEGFVRDTFGTGIALVLPEFGARDFQAAQDHDLPRMKTVGADGAFLQNVRPFSGRFVKDAEQHIVLDLEARGLLLRHAVLRHKVPHCPHCATRLIQYARPVWLLRTSAHMQPDQDVKGTPEQLKGGENRKMLEGFPEWMLGRERYWGSPLPVWECEDCRYQHCIGSVEELEQLAGRELSRLDLHRPEVDEIRFPCPECVTGADNMRRVPHILDASFDSGAMPVAQWHYPFENSQHFQEQFPADFIAETADETLDWFYSLNAVSALLFESMPHRRAAALGRMLDPNGRKPVREDGSWINPWEVIETHGADAVRWHLYTAVPTGQDRRISAGRLLDGAAGVNRTFSSTLWNVFAFFALSASQTGWRPLANSPVHVTDPLDRWLLSQLHALVERVSAALEAYDVTRANRPVQEFVRDLSRWYLRRSRLRFSLQAGETDRLSAFATLYEALVVVCKLVAPSMPFLAEDLYQRLVRPVDPDAPESVHLADWPLADPSRIDPSLDEEMCLVRELASLGQAARRRAGISIRQPLAEVAFSCGSLNENRLVEKYATLLAEELNVEHVRLLGLQGEVLSYHLRPLPGSLGSKYKALYPPLSTALLDLDSEGAGRALLSGRSLLVSLAGKAYTIQPEDVQVHVEAGSEFVSACRGARTAALKAEQGPRLQDAGFAREAIHCLQKLRRRAGLHPNERIQAYFEGSPRLQRALESHQAEIMERTRSASLQVCSRQDLPEAHRLSFDAGGETATMAITLVSS